MKIKITTEDDEFKHGVYYDSITEAINYLELLEQKEKIEQKLKQIKEDMELTQSNRTNCAKCVWENNGCPGPVIRYDATLLSPVGFCPTGYKYKRDPPDGGYYG